MRSLHEVALAHWQISQDSEHIPATEIGAARGFLLSIGAVLQAASCTYVRCLTASPPRTSSPYAVREAIRAILLAVRLAKAHADVSRDNAWLALLDLGPDLPYDARNRTRGLPSLDRSHDERYLG